MRDVNIVCAGGLNATPESFFPTLPSLSLLVEDAAEGFSSLFSRSSPDMHTCDDMEDSHAGASPLAFVTVMRGNVFMLWTVM